MTATLLIPGMLCTDELFAPQISALWPHGPVSIANTLRGESIAEIAAHILAEAPARFALAGFSMGGYLALEIMRQAPHRVDRLALISTSARPDTAEQTAGRRVLLAAAQTSTDIQRLLRGVLATLPHVSRRQDTDLVDVLARMGMVVGLEGFARQTEVAIARADSRPTLPRITQPTLVVHGADDPLIAVEMGREIAALVPRSRLVVLSECGHCSPLERPQAVNRALLEWLAG